MEPTYTLLISTTTLIAVNPDFSIRTIGRSQLNEAIQFESKEIAEKYIPNILKIVRESEEYKDDVVKKLLQRDGYSIIEYQSNLCVRCKTAMIQKPGYCMCLSCSYSGTRGV